tara:strand:+ start:602 stop:1375 length:774 start_codon:yes stop_codon:yes gene_type:complete
MNKESTIYTFLFATIMVLIVGILLACTSEILMTRKIQNAKDKKMINILTAIDEPATRLSADSLYREFIKEEIIINNQGAVLRQGEVLEDSSAFSIDVLFQARDKTLSEEDKKYPLFRASKIDSAGKKQNYFIVPMAGKGLWGPVWGFVSLKSDYNTVFGAVFDHKAETPGLGAEINTDEFENQFKNLMICDIENNFEFVSINVVKGEIKKNKHEVQGITGGTITSDGVSDMLEKTLQIYNKYFMTIRDTVEVNLELN